MNPFENQNEEWIRGWAVTATGQKLTQVVSLKEVLTKAANALDFQKKWKQNRERQSGEKHHGVGLACSYRGVSLGLKERCS